MDAIDFFKETGEVFTVYVVDRQFSIGRGLEYFKSFKGKPNYIDTNEIAHKRISSVMQWIQKKIPPIAQLIDICFGSLLPVNVVDTVTALNKLFGTEQHQAAGPDVIDPIIIQEGKVLTKYLNEIISLYKDCNFRPAIIIILKDNDFDRAKSLLANCPDGIQIKFIKNSGETQFYKVVNTGADNIEGFISAFSHQCFSTCSKTKRDVLLNEEWANNSVIRKYGPQILKIRTHLLFDEKNEVHNYINDLLNQVTDTTNYTSYEKTVLESFKCILLLFKVFCNDRAGNDLKAAYSLAVDLNNDILKAHTFRFAYFWDACSLTQQLDMLNEAHTIFLNNDIADHAIYCKNNANVTQFDTGRVYVRDFDNLLEEAISNVPGLVGMSHIFNNTGVAYLVTGQPEEAMEYFSKGVDYAHGQERTVQRLALHINKFLADFYCGEIIKEQHLRKVVNEIFDGMVRNNFLPFISSRYVLNILSISLQQNLDLGMDLLSSFPIRDLLNQGITSNPIGGGQILLQTKYLEQKYKNLVLLDNPPAYNTVEAITGVRKDFIVKYGINPFYFCTWL